MKKIKDVLKAILVILPIMFFVGNYSLATEDSTGIYLALKGKGNGRTTGFYTVTTNGGGTNKPVIKIVRSNQAGTVETADTSTSAIYCIKNGVGFGAAGSSSQPNSSVLYNQYFDLRNPSSIDSTYKAALPSNTTTYNQLVWVLDNICNPLDSSSKKKLLEAAGLSENEFQNYTIGSYSKTNIEKDIIEVIQQAAIWYFTNSSGQYHPDYDANFMWASSNGGTGRSLTDYSDDGDIVDDPVMILYQYLIDGAIEAVRNGYTYSTNSTSSPITFDKSSAKVELNGSNFLIGPYKVSATSSTAYTLTAKVTDGSSEISNVTLVGANKTTALSGSNTTEKIKSNLGNNFYISLPANTDISKVTINISTSYNSKSLTYWSTPANVVNSNQPVVIIDTSNKTATASDTQTITKPEFDLALRKFITSINGKAPTTSRVPTYTSEQLTALANGTTSSTHDNGKTLIKTHTKDPLEVSTGDKVIYTIRIYNEGQIAGKATQVTDYLPEGLELVPKSESTINTQYDWTPDESNSKIIRTSYLQNKSIAAFNTSTKTISYEDLKIECKVVAKNKTTDTTLKNIAEITSETNDAGVADRDSTPNSLTDSQKSSYNPGTSTQGKGYQDDDDYEDLVLPGKYFDLALRKFITSINGNAPTTSRVPTYSQADLKALANKTSALDDGKTLTKKHTKTPLSVKNGDKVIYTIRIYNEGEVDGKATKITDYLPEGLSLTQNSAINRTYGWQADESNSRIVSTSYLDNTNIKAFDSNPSSGTYSISYADVLIECDVVAQDSGTNTNLKNVAEITASTNDLGIVDRDSTPNNLTDAQKNSYNPGTSTQGKGYQDDDDYEDLLLPTKYFDLALRKFITSINGTAPTTSREPIITENDLKALAEGTAPLDDGKTATKQHTKDPLTVSTGDIVRYTIRVYNEGQVDGYADEITDFLPEGLEYITDSELNQLYGWKMYDASGNATDDQTKARILKTDKLSAAKGLTYVGIPADYSKEKYPYYKGNTNTLLAFDYSTMKNGPDYVSVEIECKVTSNGGQSDTRLKNVAEITAATNDDGIADRDSTPNNLTDDQKNNYNPGTSTQGKGYQDDDDYEDLLIKGKYFDLALRKFITAVNGKALNVSREPKITDEDLAKLATGETDLDNGTTVTKTHTKSQLSVATGDTVRYTIRVYNEGQVDGYATEISDFLPAGLELVPGTESEINSKYGWNADGKKITTDYLKDKKISAFDAANKKLSYEDVEIECKVVATTISGNNLKNIAEITGSKNDLNIPDKDSKVNNLTDDQKNTYNPGTSEKGKGYEDDDDYEDLKLVRFDLALRKFITGVNDESITSRIPKVDASKFGTTVDGKEVTTCTYTHSKEPVKVATNDFVTYTIRVYNEGTIDGYASVVKDNLPEGLEFLPDNQINKDYRWVMYDENGNVTTEVKNAKYITTDYLSKDQEKTTGSNLINAFDKATMDSPDYKDVKVVFKVTEPNTSDRILINQAQISKETDPDGNEVKDIDSTPDEWKDEDDEDIEKVYVKYFDLSLRKWVTHAIVIEDGVQKEMETGHYAEQEPEPIVKVELNKKRLANTVVKFRYSIRVKNEGEIEGYATEISDYIPDGLKFNQADNPQWKEANGKITTDALKDTLLKPGETATVNVVLTWINAENNMGVKTNIAEISKDYNEYGTPDIDSTPNNKKDGEDDIDDAPVALTVVTGSAPTYIALITGTLVIIAAGIFVIKKYVI